MKTTRDSSSGGRYRSREVIYLFIYIIHKYTYYIPTLYTRHDDEDRGAARAQYPISSCAAHPLLSSIIIIRTKVL